MGLKDRYAQATGQAVLPAAITTPSGPAPALASGAQPVSALPSRNMADIRAKLAQSGGVNPPEAQTRVSPLDFEPKTQETPSGGAEPLPQAVVPQATSPVVSAAPVPGAAEPTRGQKAAATRAANKAANKCATNAGGVPGLVATSRPASETPAAAPVAGSGAGSAAEESAAVYPTEFLAVLTRIARALETMVLRGEDIPF